MPDGYWYHGNGKPMGEFCHIKPNDKERYGEYVKVVRCKDCKHADIFHQCDRVEFWTSGDDFCSRGERRDEDNTETLEAWDLDGSPTRYIRGQREDKAQDCEACKNRKTCKDAPIPSCYACLGYEPTEAST